MCTHTHDTQMCTHRRACTLLSSQHRVLLGAHASPSLSSSWAVALGGRGTSKQEEMARGHRVSPGPDLAYPRAAAPQGTHGHPMVHTWLSLDRGAHGVGLASYRGANQGQEWGPALQPQTWPPPLGLPVSRQVLPRWPGHWPVGVGVHTGSLRARRAHPGPAPEMLGGWRVSPWGQRGWFAWGPPGCPATACAWTAHFIRPIPAGWGGRALTSPGLHGAPRTQDGDLPGLGLRREQNQPLGLSSAGAAGVTLGQVWGSPSGA